MIKYYKYISDSKIKKGFSLTKEALCFANQAGFSRIYKDGSRPCVDGGFVSCAHSFNRAYLVFSDKRVGIDCEKKRPAPPFLKARLGSRTDRDFFERWTMYEAAVKATGKPLFKIVKNGTAGLNLDYTVFEDDGFIVSIASVK